MDLFVCIVLYSFAVRCNHETRKLQIYEHQRDLCFIRVIQAYVITFWVLFFFSIPVLGLVNPTDIGVTLTHEHLSMTYDHAYREPNVGDEKNVDIPLTLGSLGWVRQYP